MKYFSLIVLATFLSACGNETLGPTPTPTPPQQGNVSGSWTGQGNRTNGGDFTLALDLNSSGATISGTATFTGGLEGASSVNGTLTGASLTLSSSTLNLSATLAGDRLTGGGTFTLESGATAQLSFALTKSASAPNPSPTDPPPTTPPPSNPPPQGVSVTGTVAAPPGGDVAGTLVAACLNGDCRDTANYIETRITQNGTQASYTTSGLKAGESYLIPTFKDINGNGAFDEGDYFGAYTATGTESAPVTPPATAVDIQLLVFGGGGQVGQALLGTWNGLGTEVGGYGLTDVTLTIDRVSSGDSSAVVSGYAQFIGDYNGNILVEGSYF